MMQSSVLIMKNNLYLGIDPSYTNTEIIAVDDDAKIIFQDGFGSPLSKKGLEGKRANEYFYSAIKSLRSIEDWNHYSKVYICVEYPMVVHRGASAKVHETFAICYCASEIVFHADTSICYPYDWKKFIGTKHNANMRMVSNFMLDKYSIEFPNFDLYAAYGIALYLRGKIRGERDW